MTQTTMDARPKPSRVEQERARRRRRQDDGTGRLRTLAIEGELDPNYTYRWINDDPGRVHALTVMDDWEKVTAADLGQADDRDKNLGTGVERIVDKVTGKRAVLVRKLKEFYVEDKAKEQKRLEELDAMIKHGQVPATPPQSEGISAKDMNAQYVPQGAINIRNGAKG